jgi:inward rectifier potassium channel
LLQGIEETFSQIVHARSSYKFDEIIWNAKFADIYNRPTDDQKISMDIGRLSEIKRL